VWMDELMVSGLMHLLYVLLVHLVWLRKKV